MIRTVLIICMCSLCAMSATSFGDERALSVVPASPANWALLIGVNEYTSFSKLKYCDNDVQALAQRLAASGFPAEHVFRMHDSAETKKYLPFGTNIRQQLNLILGELDETGERIDKRGLLGPQDTFLFAFSGHGAHFNGVSYLCPIDADLSDPETMISVDRLYRQLELCPANVRLCLIDACRNDPLPGGARSADGQKSNADALGESLLKVPSKGTLVLASCAAGQVSFEDPDLKHGVFMNFLLDGLAGAADAAGNRNGRVSVFEICSYVSEHTRSHVANTRSQVQTPEFNGRIVDFDLVTVRVGDALTKPIAATPPKPSVTERYTMNPALVRTGDLPKDWSGDDSVASQKASTGATLIQLRPGTAELSFDKLNAVEPFYVDFEYYLGGWSSSLECALTGGDAQDIIVKSAHNGGNTNCVASLNGFPAKQIGSSLNDYKHAARIEVSDGRLRLLIDGAEIQAIRWQQSSQYTTARFALSTQDERHYAAAQSTSLLSFRSGPLLTQGTSANGQPHGTGQNQPSRTDLEKSANFSFALASYFHDLDSPTARARGGVIHVDYNSLIAPKGSEPCLIWRSEDGRSVFVHSGGETLGFRASAVRSVIYPKPISNGQ